MRKVTVIVVVAVAAGLSAPAVARADADAVSLGEFKVDADAWCDVREQWQEQLLATHEAGTWAPLTFRPSDAQLRALGLPSARALTGRRYPKPTFVKPDGTTEQVDPSVLQAATVASFAGTGCLGIRPGAWLLLLDGGGVGWCSMAHVYGSPGSYSVSTAGHCGKNGDVATVIAAMGNRGGVTGPILLDFGTFTNSHDGGLGNDWALVDVFDAYQGLVSPTMCFWGGPRGMYTKSGATLAVTFPRRRLVPTVTVNPDPTLAQAVVHYGHGLGVGTGGTPRAGTAFHWGTSHFMFEGAVTPGDSGSGVNTAGGDVLGATMEAAGIVTHIWIDPLMRQGIGIMGGTRATAVGGTLANGQIVPYPAPAPGLP